MGGQSFIPIYKQLKDYYTQRILSQEYPPGARVDSIHRMMLRHQVSRETAKLVLRELIQEGLIVSIQGKGSFVVPQTVTNDQWGMIIPFFSPNMEQMIYYLDGEAQKRGKQLHYFLGYNNPEEEKRLVGSMVLEGYEAVVVVPNYDESLTADFYRNLIHGHTTVVLVDQTMSGSYFRYVVQSYDLGIKRAVEYLFSHTRGNLVMVRNDTWKGRNLLDEFMEETLRNTITVNYPDRSVQILPNVRSMTKSFIEEMGIEGILTTTDSDAIRVLGRLKSWGVSVPSKARLVNYGNTELTKFFSPAITAIDCLYGEMARKTALLIDMGQRAGAYEQHVIQPELVIRET
jgi:DNA-binding LacI/PurR family transcriptional regulator